MATTASSVALDAGGVPAITPAAATGSENVKVIVRARPMNEREQKLVCKNVITIGAAERSIELRNPKDAADLKEFAFYAVYGIAVVTERIYGECVAPLVESVLEGYNATIFAYGQTGSGKSFSMQGIEKFEGNRGIIPRAFEHVFDAVQTSSKAKFLVHCAYIEIYMEEVRDLLSKTDYKKPLDLRESPNKAVYVQGLTWNAVKSVEECQKIMERGWRNRSVGETLMNRESSRSHSVFTIAVERMTTHADDGSEHIVAGKLNLVDLAGSERQSKTGATGDRLKEATKINLSLSALANVISALTDPKVTHVPFRDSKLTRLLQDSLGGNTKTLMLACISPADNNYEETLSTLRYASRAQRIKNKPTVNEDPKDALLRQYQEEIMRLKTMLEQHVKGNNHHLTAEGMHDGQNAVSGGGRGAFITPTPSVFNIEAERRRLEIEKQRALDEQTRRLQHEFEQQMLALRQNAAAQQAQLEQAQAQQQDEQTRALQREKAALQESIDALRRQYEERITESAEKQNAKTIDESATVGPDVVIVDAGDDQPLIGSKAVDDNDDKGQNVVQKNIVPSDVRQQKQAEFTTEPSRLLLSTAAQCSIQYADKAVQAGRPIVSSDGAVPQQQVVGYDEPAMTGFNGIELGGDSTEPASSSVNADREATYPPSTVYSERNTLQADIYRSDPNQKTRQIFAHKPAALSSAIPASVPSPLPPVAGEDVSEEELRKRIAELEKQVVGGERKDDEEAVRRREKQRLTADEHRRKFAQIIANVGERENDEQAMFEVYENIQSDLVAQERQLKAAKRKIVSLTHELQDVRDEFGEERSNMLQMTREAERQRQLFEQMLNRIVSVVRRDCNYVNVDAVKGLSLWDDRAQQWILPSIKFDQLGLDDAPSLPDGFDTKPQSTLTTRAALNDNFDDQRLFDRLARVKTDGLRIKRQDHLRGGGQHTNSNANDGGLVHDMNAPQAFTADELDSLLNFPKISSVSAGNSPRIHPAVAKPRTSQSSSSRSNSSKSNKKEDRKLDKRFTELINLPRPKL